MQAKAQMDEWIRTIERGGKAEFQSAADIRGAMDRAWHMSGAEQVAEIQRVGAAAMSMWQANMQAIEQIKALAKSIHQSFQDAIEAINLDQMDATQKASYLGNKLKDLNSQLMSATSAEEVNRITSEIQRYGSQYLSQFAADDPNRKAAEDWLKQFYTDADLQAQIKLKEFTDKLTKENDAIWAELKKASKTLGENIDEAKGKIWELTVELNKLKDAFSAWGTKIEEQIPGLEAALQQLSAAFRDAGDRFADEIIAAAAPLKTELDAMKLALMAVTQELGGDPAADDSSSDFSGTLVVASSHVSDFGSALAAVVPILRSIATGGGGTPAATAPTGPSTTYRIDDNVGPRAAAWAARNPTAALSRLGR